jgi:hypothetical protein
MLALKVWPWPLCEAFLAHNCQADYGCLLRSYFWRLAKTLQGLVSARDA